MSDTSAGEHASPNAMHTQAPTDDDVDFALFYQDEEAKGSSVLKGQADRALGGVKAGKDAIGNQVHKVNDGFKAGKDAVGTKVGAGATATYNTGKNAAEKTSRGARKTADAALFMGGGAPPQF